MAGLSTIFSLILTRIATVSNSRSDEAAMGQPPLIYEGPPSGTTTYHVGNRVILPCRAHGTPPLQFDWYQDGHLLETSIDPESNFFVLNGTLHLKTSSSLTDGDFQCLAINNYGVDMSNISHLQKAVFQDRQSRRIVHNLIVSEGRRLVLRCDHVISIPPPTVRWYTTEMKSRDSHVPHPVHANDRITMDDSGGLVITAIRKSDARDDLVYKCAAYNYVTRQTNGGDYFRIRVREESYDTDSSPELIYSSTKVTVHIGTNVTLTCIFSGRPIPTMSWARRGGAALPASAAMVDFGRRLVLTDVSFDDEGYYVCSATNDIAKTQSSISLNIVASPRLNLALENRNITEGNSLSFSCEADARPATHVTWFINARPINSSSVHLSWALQRETLTLFDLQLEDSSTVTCNISNDFGYVLSSAYFMVLPSQATTASPFETSAADTDHDVPVVMATVTSFNDVVSIGGYSTEDPDVYENSFTDDIEEDDMTPTEDYVTEELPEYPGFRIHDSPRVDSGESDDGDGGVVSRSKWLDSNLMKCLWFSIPVLLLIGFGFLVWQRYRNRKTTYRVEEQEKKHGSNNIDYDSEDSGYDEQKAERSVKKFKILEKELT